MDFTGTQMIVTLKIISAAVVFQDGLKPEKVSASYNAHWDTDELSSLTPAICLGESYAGTRKVYIVQ